MEKFINLVKDESIDLKKVTTHSRNFSHEQVVAYVVLKTLQLYLKHLLAAIAYVTI